ncbi:MAG TPA: hypothetical protein VM933_02025 [Acidimicrobiales bacterium]|nr:hypothetical protein [Acidimicrobiales bacterium]
MKALDLLELELRRLPQVAFVGFRDRPDTLLVQILALDGADPGLLRTSAERACRAHLDRPFVVEVAGGTSPSRIRLLDVQLRRDVDDDVEVEVHLGFEGAHTVGRARGGDPTAAAAATFEALQRLGAKVPFQVEAAALFEHVLGEGVMLVLGSEHAGQRYGVAAGTSVEQAAVRATLHALNRYLATQTLPALAG